MPPAPKSRHVLIILLIACALLSLSCRSEIDKKGPVAMVNGKPITGEQFLSELRRRYGRQALDDMICDALIRQRASALKLQASDADIQRAHAEAAAHAGSEADLKRLLEREGISEAEFRRSLEAGVLLDKIVAQSVEVTPDEIRSYYAAHRDEFRRGEQIRVRFMMLESEENADEVRSVLEQPGADFAGLAKVFSTDPATKESGGDTGYFERGYFAKPIEDVAFGLKEGEISPVFKGPDGWCIVQLIDRKPPETQPISAVEQQIRSRLMYQKEEEAKQRWCAEAQKAAKIEIRPKDLKPLSAGDLKPR